MHVIDLCERFFREYGADVIRGFEDCVSAGLVGNGSECFGYDDEISLDHDVGADFCLWVDDSAYSEVAPVLEERLLSLPDRYMGLERAARRTASGKRRGVFSCGEFYRSLIGYGTVPGTPAEWLKIPDYALAAASNGRVFTDGATDFTYMRNMIINGIPADVRTKKLSRAVIMAAQYGQYNYSRCIRHGEIGASRLALDGFCQNIAFSVYYLNRKHPPFYKWLFRGMRQLERGAGIAEELEKLLVTFDPPECVGAVERISAHLLRLLTDDGYTCGSERYLEPHAYRIAAKIRDRELSAMHIME